MSPLRFPPLRRSSQVGESWKTMAPYLMGGPCGGRSSQFVNAETGQAMKVAYQAVLKAGVFGPEYEG